MKKIEKIILVIIAVMLMSVTADVSASTTGATIVDGGTTIYNVKDKNGKLQNVSAQQEIGGAGAYCLDPGYNAASNLKAARCEINKISSPDFATIENMVNSLNQKEGENTYYYRQLLLRYWAMDTSLIKGKKSAIWNHISSYDLNLKDESKEIVRNAGFTRQYSLEGGSSVFDFVQTSGGVTGDSFSYTYKIVYTGGGSIINWNNVMVKLTNKSNSSIIYSKNGDTITVTGNIKECKGASFTVKAETDASNITGSTNNGNNGNGMIIPGNNYYFVECGEGYQNYIIMGRPDADFGYENDGDDGDGDSDNDGNSGKYKGKKRITIDDPECNCDINYSSEFVCDGSGKSDLYINETDNVIACITSGNYKNSCGEGQSIEKTDGKLQDNPYCRVFCKEDIDFSLPGEVKVKNGTYFKLTSPFTENAEISVSGTRTCYAGPDKDADDDVKGINQKKYIKDIKDAQDEIIKAYNNYEYTKAMVKAIADAETAGEKDSTCSASCRKKVNGTWTGSDSGTTVHYYEASVDYTAYETGKYDSEGVWTGKNSTTTQQAVAFWGQKNGAASCNGNNATCTATTEIKKSDLTKKYNQDAINDAKEAIGDKIKELEEKVLDYRACFYWDNKYCSFNPILSFEYEEKYDVEGELKQKGDIVIGTNNRVGAYELVDDKYLGNAGPILEEEQSYVHFSSSLTSKIYKLDMTHIYVKKEADSKKEFEGYVDKKVCSYHPHGTIEIGDSCKANDGNYVFLNGDGYVFPVSLQKEETRKYNYDLKISNIGAPGNDSTCVTENLNRIVGESCSKYEKQTKKTDAKYTCYYSSCPECDVTCVCPPNRPDCYVEDKVCKYVECDDCKVSCIGCLWNDGNATFAYKPISLSDVFPNSDEDKVGYNWNTDNTINPDADKSQVTIDDIQKKGEEIYRTPEYSYTLSPSTMAAIRKYNEVANGTKKGSSGKFKEINPGGYNNNTLKCHNGEKCTSSFLDALDEMNVSNARSTKWKVFKNGQWTSEN